jgi:hypothetical protein
MNEFKVGDVVRLKTIAEEPSNIDIFNSDSLHDKELVKCTKVTVTCCHCGILRVCNTSETLEYGWYDWRFTLVKPKRKSPIKRKNYALWIHNIEKKRKAHQ